MAKKAIAMMLLVAMVAWAEMAFAPMLAMHAGHMRPGHEMAADMPAQYGHHAQHQQAKAEGLPCCPGFHKAQPEAAPMVSAGAPACDDPHSCCFRQGPQSVPAPVRDAQKMTRDITPALVAKLTPACQTARIALHDSTFGLSPPAVVFGMILRI
jgi:hypothetical protein